MINTLSIITKRFFNWPRSPKRYRAFQQFNLEKTFKATGLREIIYLCPANNRPIGGVKVIYKHSEILMKNGFNSSILHPRNTQFKCDWFSHEATIRSHRTINQHSDFVVIPETWAERACSWFIENNVKYAIFVQNGYLLNSFPQNEAAYERNREAYLKAALILSISEDTTNMIRLAYPSIAADKIVRLFPHIDNNFRSAKKEKIIAYMPRKLPEHSKKVCFYLKQNLPESWKLIPIERLNEKQVQEILSKTSIFMSFCDQEGCPLPPLEAAFSGALVVGYTGQGAKEYFSQPNFREIENGNFKLFTEQVLRAIDEVESGKLEEVSFVSGIARLRDTYLETNEKKHLLAFASKVSELYQ